MADPQKPSKTPTRGPWLPALERLSPVPDLDTISDEIAARTKPGDVVLTRFVRDGQEQDVRVTLATRQAQ